jgi:hypothetical protein
MQEYGNAAALPNEHAIREGNNRRGNVRKLAPYGHAPDTLVE